MKPILMAILMCCMASAVHATSQVPERLVYGGITNDMYSTPLESLFSADNPKPKLFYERPSSTACYRGYVGTWKVGNDELYLVALQSCRGVVSRHTDKPTCFGMSVSVALPPDHSRQTG